MRDKSLCSGERQRGATLDKIEPCHRWRYEQALKYVAGKRVLDLGCGVGYGSFILSAGAVQVWGLDDSIESIEFARKHYQRHNIVFLVQNIEDYEMIAIKYKTDIIVAFEVLEHLDNAMALFQLCKLVQPKLVIMSTPHRLCPIGKNVFHKKHYGFDELVDLFLSVGYKPKDASLKYFNKSLTNFMIMERVGV